MNGGFALKKILIVSQAMEIGGAEKALLGLLEIIDTEKYDVDLFLYRHTGELLKEIPCNIRLLPEKSEYKMLGVPIQEVIQKHEFGIAFGRLIGRIRAFLYGKMHQLNDIEAVEDLYSHKYTVGYLPFISETEYDLAISFLTPHYIVEKNVKARKKIGWIHTDYKAYKGDTKSELKMWGKLDAIISISEQVTKSFSAVFPALSDKICLIQNIVPVQYMKALTCKSDVSEEMPDTGAIKLLSVGRFCTAKNFDNVPEICRNLIEKGLDVVWYLIGYGGDEKLIRSKISEYGMEKHVIILGKRENPYPYFCRCDIYVQPSRFEGKCVSVIEAQMLHKPVIITRYGTSGSQLKDGIDGVIVPMDILGCSDGIANVILNSDLRQRLIDGTNREDYALLTEIFKLYKFVEE